MTKVAAPAIEGRTHVLILIGYDGGAGQGRTPTFGQCRPGEIQQRREREAERREPAPRAGAVILVVEVVDHLEFELLPERARELAHGPAQQALHGRPGTTPR